MLSAVSAKQRHNGDHSAIREREAGAIPAMIRRDGNNVNQRKLWLIKHCSSELLSSASHALLLSTAASSRAHKNKFAKINPSFQKDNIWTVHHSCILLQCGWLHKQGLLLESCHFPPRRWIELVPDQTLGLPFTIVEV